MPLTIEDGRARLPGSSRLTSAGFEGTVGPHGELAMRLASTPLHKDFPGYEIIITGSISSDGTVRARELRQYCNYDVVWRKEFKQRSDGQ
jgi:hypothetical protein